MFVRVKIEKYSFLYKNFNILPFEKPFSRDSGTHIPINYHSNYQHTDKIRPIRDPLHKSDPDWTIYY